MNSPRIGAAVVPDALADVALVDAPACAAAASMGLTQWHDLVRRGAAPAPAIRRPRFTRWRLRDVRNWLATVSDHDPAVVAKARHASHAAQARRGALRQQTGGVR